MTTYSSNCERVWQIPKQICRFETSLVFEINSSFQEFYRLIASAFSGLVPSHPPGLAKAKKRIAAKITELYEVPAVYDCDAMVEVLWKRMYEIQRNKRRVGPRKRLKVCLAVG